MDKPDTDILTEEQVAKVAETVEANYPLRLYLSRFGIDVSALCRTLRAALQKHELDEHALQEFRRIAENEITRLREQLAEAHKNVESLSQTIFRSEHATAMRDLCVATIQGMSADTFGGIRKVEAIGRIESLTLDQVKETQS